MVTLFPVGIFTEPPVANWVDTESYFTVALTPEMSLSDVWLSLIVTLTTVVL
jgi:hypothetical protein